MLSIPTTYFTSYLHKYSKINVNFRWEVVVLIGNVVEHQGHQWIKTMTIDQESKYMTFHFFFLYWTTTVEETDFLVIFPCIICTFSLVKTMKYH